MNQGNAKNFNSNINVTIAKNDIDRENNRLWAPQAVIRNGPSMETHGRMSQTPQYYDNNINNNRLDSNLLEAFKANPYTHSLHSVA